MPAQKRLRRHDQSMAARRWEQSRKRREESTIGRSERRARLLTAEDEQLMSQHQKLDVFGEVAASPSQQQLQDRREREIKQRKGTFGDAPRALPVAARPEPMSRTVRRCKAGRIWHTRARDPLIRVANSKTGG
jgi:hypothetical protein